MDGDRDCWYSRDLAATWRHTRVGIRRDHRDLGNGGMQSDGCVDNKPESEPQHHRPLDQEHNNLFDLPDVIDHASGHRRGRGYGLERLMTPEPSRGVGFKLRHYPRLGTFVDTGLRESADLLSSVEHPTSRYRWTES